MTCEIFDSVIKFYRKRNISLPINIVSWAVFRVYENCKLRGKCLLCTRSLEDYTFSYRMVDSLHLFTNCAMLITAAKTEKETLTAESDQLLFGRKIGQILESCSSANFMTQY